MASAVTVRRKAGEEGGEPSLGEEDFAYFARLVYDLSRIVLRAEKRALVQGRLARRMRALGLATVREYRAHLAGPGGEAELVEMINAVTTNLTSFFREPHHFRHLATTALPAVTARATNRRLRVWSAGCSSGQETYSIALTMLSSVPNLAAWDARVLGTDLDTTMVERAAGGVYPIDQLNTIPEQYRRAISPGRSERATRERDTFAMPAAARDLITFKPLNLMDNWPMRGPFDVIFCRNVVIYFDKPTQIELFDRFADILAPQGWLYIGHAESLFRVSDRFEAAGTTVYRKLG